MPSIQAFIVKQFIWFTEKWSMSTVEGIHKAIAKRQIVDLPTSMYASVDVAKRQIGQFTVYDVSPNADADISKRILYVHGGSLVFSLTQYHWLFIAHLAKQLNAKITVPMYPLGPEHKIADMYSLLQPIYDEMAAEEGPFIGMGDSAGGTLMLGLTMEALAAKKPVADKLLLICPVVDYGLSNPDTVAAEKNDPFLTILGLQETLKMATGDVDVADRRISPIRGVTEGLPPTLMFMGGLDLLKPDQELYIAKAKESGCNVESITGEGMLHNWVIFPIPEGKQAQERAVEWLKEY